MTTSTRKIAERTTRAPRLGRRWRCAAAVLAAGVLLGSPAFARKTPPRTVEEEFGRDVELAPFVVRGEQLAISVHARSGRDRKYAEVFAGEVVNVVYEGVTQRTGKGLVIIGAKGEPHPVVVFGTFQAMADAGQLHPEVAARAGELRTFLEGWKGTMDRGEATQLEAEDAPEPGGTADKQDRHVAVDLEFEHIVHALPLPLEGVGAKLYQIAWAERFDEAKLDARLRSLRPEDLEGDAFVRFDWVFYLPPRGVFDRVLNDVIDQALAEEDMGFLSRMAARTILAVVKPVIRRAIEGMRKGMLFMTIVRAQTEYSDERVSAVTTAYVEQLMPGAEKRHRGGEQERAVAAVREALAELDRAAAEAEAAEALEAVVNLEQPVTSEQPRARSPESL